MSSEQSARAGGSRGTALSFEGRPAIGSPPVRTGNVPRPRLVDRLDLGIQRPFTLISAPAGFGKTMLVKSWAERYRGPAQVRYVRLTTDGEPAAALKSVPQLLRSDDRQVLVLVVDCGEQTITPEFGRSLDRLVRGYGGRFRVVLLTRYDPPLPLHQYRLADAIAEIQAADLAFTLDETRALMREFRTDLSDGQLTDLQTRTGGWPVGLMFAAVNLAGKSDPGRVIREFRGDTGNVAAYLMAEVLNAQPPELRMFLLRTSLVDVITPGLAAALTGRHCDLRSLEFLARGNSLIQPVAGTAAGYSYLALFREFLRAEMLYTQPALVPELHRTAAAWFAQHGQTMEAIHHAVTAGDWSLAARYLVADLDTLSLVVRRRRRQLTTLLTAMPDEVDGPQAAVVRAALALAEFDVDRCRSQLRRVRTWPNDPESTDGKAVELAGSLLQAGCAGFGNGTDADLDAVLVANSRLNAASPRSLADHPEAALLVLGCKGRVLLQRGDFAGAVAAFDDAIALAEHAGAHETLTEFLGIAALAEAIRGRLRRTGEMVAHASTLAAVGTPPELPRSALVAQAWMHTDQGDLAEAGKLVQRAEAAPEPTTADARVVAAAYALVRARLLRASGDAERATAELRAASADLGGRGSWLDQALQRAVAAIGGRGPTQPPGVVEPAAPLDTQVEGWLVQAAESVRAGETARGVLCLERALRLAAPEHLRRPFDEAPEVLRSLLLPTGEAGRRHPWLRGPAEQASHRAVDHDEPPRHDLVITAALTGKEQEVLGHLAELLTTEEIADTMFVSVNTVRSHVRSILRKLGASRRNEAVRRAWELGLLPSHED